MALNQEAIAAAVAKEIERQQKEVVYEDLSVDELNNVCAQLTAKLELVKAAMDKKGGAAEAPMKARKAEGNFPELPWGGACLAVHIAHTACSSQPQSLRGVTAASCRDAATLRAEQQPRRRREMRSAAAARSQNRLAVSTCVDRALVAFFVDRERKRSLMCSGGGSSSGSHIP